MLNLVCPDPAARARAVSCPGEQALTAEQHLHLLTQLFCSHSHPCTTPSPLLPISLGPGLTLWGISHQSSNSLLTSNPQTNHKQDAAAALSSQGTSFSSPWLTAGAHGRVQQKGDLTFPSTLPWPLLRGIYSTSKANITHHCALQHFPFKDLPPPVMGSWGSHGTELPAEQPAALKTLSVKLINLVSPCTSPWVSSCSTSELVFQCQPTPVVWGALGACLWLPQRPGWVFTPRQAEPRVGSWRQGLC